MTPPMLVFMLATGGGAFGLAVGGATGWTVFWLIVAVAGFLARQDSAK